MLDNSVQPRFAARSAGRLLSRDGRCNMSCTLKDVSEDGACVSAMDLGDVPEHVYLLVEKSGELFQCEVTWHRADELGVRFVDAASRFERNALLRSCVLSPAA